MTNKEKLIVKRLGYTTYVLFRYSLTNHRPSREKLISELGMSQQSITRGYKALTEANIVKLEGKYKPYVYLLPEDMWNLK
jgi:DNA-binding transcriptional ArsR family regulator